MIQYYVFHCSSQNSPTVEPTSKTRLLRAQSLIYASHLTPPPSLPPSRSLSLSMSVCLRLCLDIAACRNCGRLALLQATPAHLRAACVSGIQIPVGHDHLRRKTVDEDVVEMKEENVVEMKEEDVVEMKEKYVNMWYR